MTANRPKVALFATTFLEYSQTFIYDEISSHRGYDIEVFSARRTNLAQFPHEPVHSLQPTHALAQAMEHLLYKLTTYSPSFMTKLRSGGFKLLHAHFGPGSIYALPYQRALQVPLIVTFHGYDVPLLLTPRRYRPEFWRYWLLSRKMLERTTRFLAASEELHSLLLELGAPPERTYIWRLGVKIPMLDRLCARDGKNILMVGRFVEKKGFEYGIEAFADVIRGGLDATLTIVGGGARKQSYLKLVRRHGIEGRVRFPGALSHEEVLAQMDRCDVLVAPSVVAANGDRESGLLVVKEAGARSVPVIGTRHGGIPEIIDHEKTGFLVPERDSGAIAEKLSFLLKDGDLRARLGRGARRKMELEYDIEHCVQALEQHYDEVIGGWKT